MPLASSPLDTISIASSSDELTAALRAELGVLFLAAEAARFPAEPDILNVSSDNLVDVRTSLSNICQCSALRPSQHLKLSGPHPNRLKPCSWSRAVTCLGELLAALILIQNPHTQQPDTASQSCPTS